MAPRFIQVSSGLGAGNIGDEFMARAFWDALPENVRLRVEHYNLFPRHSESYPRQHEFLSVPISSHSSPGAPDLPGLLVGTTPVSERLGLDWPLGTLASRLAAFANQGLRVDAVGVGVESLNRLETIDLFRAHFLGIRTWTVRSESCRNALLDLGVPERRILVGADWAWLYRPLRDTREEGAALWRGLGVNLERPLLVVGLAGDSPTPPEAVASALDQLSHAMQIAFFANDVRGRPGSDAAMIAAIRARMRRPSFVVPPEPYLPDEQLGLLAHATVTMGSRYHFILASVLAGVVPVGIVRGEKIQSLLQDLALPPAGDEQALEPAALVAAVRKAREDWEVLKRMLAEKQESLRKRAANNLSFIRGSLMGEKAQPSAHSGSAPLPLLDSFRRILVPRFDGIGDLILLAGFLEALLSRLSPDVQVDLLVRRGLESLAPLFPARLRWIPMTLTPYRQPAPREQEEALRGFMTSSRHDLVIFSCFSRTWADQVVLDAMARDARSVGFSAVEEHTPEVGKYQALWRQITGSEEPLRPRLRVPDDVQLSARRLLASLGLADKGYLLVAPAGTAQVDIKTWSAGAFAESITRLETELGLVSLVVGLESERTIIETTVGMAVRAGAHPRLWMGQGPDLPLLAGLIQGAAGYLGNDSGPMHLASALGVPVVAIFGGGTWPRFVPAQGARALVHTLPCFGCGWDCRFHSPICLDLVGVAPVVEATRSLLSGEDDQRSVVLDLRPEALNLPPEHHALFRALRSQLDRARPGPGFAERPGPRIPSRLERFPADLRAPGLHYLGIFPDGWVGHEALVVLQQNQRAAVLHLAGMVPLVDDPGFTTELRVHLDGVEVLRQTLALGRFEFFVPVENPGLKRIELALSHVQPLLPPDERKMAILLECLGFESR